MSLWSKLGLADRHGQEHVISELHEIIRNQQVQIDMLRDTISTLNQKSISYEEKLEQSIKLVRQKLETNLNHLDNLGIVISSNHQEVQEMITNVLKNQENSQVSLKRMNKVIKQNIQDSFTSVTKDVEGLQEMVKLVWVNDLLSDLEKVK
jgi:hypothetical protein